MSAILRFFQHSPSMRPGLLLCTAAILWSGNVELQLDFTPLWNCGVHGCVHEILNLIYQAMAHDHSQQKWASPSSKNSIYSHLYILDNCDDGDDIDAIWDCEHLPVSTDRPSNILVSATTCKPTYVTVVQLSFICRNSYFFLYFHCDTLMKNNHISHVFVVCDYGRILQIEKKCVCASKLFGGLFSWGMFWCLGAFSR